MAAIICSMSKSPVNRETMKKLIDALTPMNPDTAEKFVQDLLRVAEERRREIERVVGDVARAGVRTAEGVASSVQHELSKQVSRMAARVDDLEKQVESLGRTIESTRSNVMSLVSRSLGGGSDPVDSVEVDPKKSKVSKSDKKKEKKALRKATKVSSESDQAPPAVAGI